MTFDENLWHVQFIILFAPAEIVNKNAFTIYFNEKHITKQEKENLIGLLDILNLCDR